MEEMADKGYGCAVANRFGRLLDDETDPFDLLYQAQVKSEQRKKKEELKKVVTSTKTSKKESQRDRKAVVRVGENPTNRAVAGKSLTSCVIGACAVRLSSCFDSAGQKRPVRAAAEERAERHVAFSEAKSSEGEVSLGYSIER